MSNQGPLILIVDDKTQIRCFLRISLEANGYRVEETALGMEAISKTAQSHPDLVILDMELPDMYGLDVLKRLREWTHIPVIILSVRDDDSDKVSALDAGADDYLSKPFSVDELLARIRTAQRHAQPHQEQAIFTSAQLEVDLSRRLVTVDGQIIKLTPTAYALLRFMIQHAGKVLTHQQILKAVWGPEYIHETHYLRVYFAQLRQKIEREPNFPQIIITESGIGYRLIQS